MLVYVNRFVFKPNSADQIIQLVAKWVGARVKGYIDPDRLAEGIRELKLKDGSALTSRATLSDDRQRVYPFWFCSQLSHRDDKVSGRRWITEIGLRQEAEGDPVECTILLRTEEVSARVLTSIQVTRPRLVEQLVVSCNPAGQTPGLSAKKLTLDSAAAFLREVERDERDYPIVVLSANRAGIYPVTAERLCSIVVGLAEVACVPPDEDTFAIEEVVGRNFMAFGGAINILFPGRQGNRGHFYETVLIRPEEIVEILAGGSSVESEVLSAITHRTNLPFSWRHISPERVSQERLRAQLARVIEQAKSGDHSEELVAYVELLEAADEELQLKDNELKRTQFDLEERNQEVRALEADVVGLKHALSSIYSSDEEKGVSEEFVSLRNSVAETLKDGNTLQGVVDLMATLYPDRMVFLESSRTSAKESDRGGFRQGGKAIELLHKLATEYWQHLADGNSDQQAKSVFGQNGYAANEASVLSNDGKRRRTFAYGGSEFFMERHLKFGVKDSVAETLRIHFEWLANEKKIIIGHCGKHLDF